MNKNSVATRRDETRLLAVLSQKLYLVSKSRLAFEMRLSAVSSRLVKTLSCLENRSVSCRLVETGKMSRLLARLNNMRPPESKPAKPKKAKTFQFVMLCFVYCYFKTNFSVKHCFRTSYFVDIYVEILLLLFNITVLICIFVPVYTCCKRQPSTIAFCVWQCRDCPRLQNLSVFNR